MGDIQLSYPRGVTFEQVWAALQETDRQIKESQRETDRLIKDSQQETDRQIKETQRETDRLIKETDRQMKETDRQIKETQRETDRLIKETDRQMKETDRQIKETQRETDRQIKDLNKRFGEYSNRLGEIAEYMVAPNLREKFRELGLIFPKANRNSDVSDYDNDIFMEIDVMLENGEKAMLVEIKTKLISDHVNAHLERLEKMRKYANLHGDKRAFLGSVAGVVIPDNIKKLALDNGLFVIEPSGETFKITPPIGKPKEW
ncbi:MAG: hypothetical protein FWC21_03155 [Treponema sp.]|nr:hypothetical protein [Treponema sp.]